MASSAMKGHSHGQTLEKQEEIPWPFSLIFSFPTGASCRPAFPGKPAGKAMWVNSQSQGWRMTGHGPDRRLSSQGGEQNTGSFPRRGRGCLSIRKLKQEGNACQTNLSWVTWLSCCALSSRAWGSQLSWSLDWAHVFVKFYRRQNCAPLGTNNIIPAVHEEERKRESSQPHLPCHFPLFPLYPKSSAPSVSPLQ